MGISRARASKWVNRYSDLAFNSWSRGTTTLPALPRLSIADVSAIQEGDSGTRTADFVMTLSRPSRHAVTAHVETSGFFFDRWATATVLDDDTA